MKYPSGRNLQELLHQFQTCSMEQIACMAESHTVAPHCVGAAESLLPAGSSLLNAVGLPFARQQALELGVFPCFVPFAQDMGTVRFRKGRSGKSP